MGTPLAHPWAYLLAGLAGWKRGQAERILRSSKDEAEARARIDRWRRMSAPPPEARKGRTREPGEED